ncbi:MAG: cupin domain-containing protein [Ferruginibacter sp.]
MLNNLVLNFKYGNKAGNRNMYKEIEQIEPKEIVKGYKARFIHSEMMTMAFWEVEAGAVMPIHQHIHEQISQVLEGKFELVVAGKRIVYEPGFVAVIPSNTPHGGVAITNCKLLDMFSPAREDYK